MADVEAGLDGDNKSDDFNYGYNFEFSEKSIRLAFIRKVYGILLAQLVITFGFVAAFVYITPLREYCADPANQWIWILALVMTFVCLIPLACCPGVRRTFPTNFIFLFLFTICEGFLLGTMAGAFAPTDVLIAVGITAALVLGITLFAFQTKWDFTMMGGGLLVVLIVFMIFGFLCAIIQSHYLNMFYAAMGALIFGLYLVFDTQLMLGGKHKYTLSPEEYIFAALNLYLDIINIFIYVLALVGAVRN